MLGAHLSTVEIVVRLTVAAVLGGLLGFERERDGHEAGFRTHLLLAVGAALFGMISIGAFDDFSAPADQTNFVIDPTRIASYVAVAVGFIGAGAIVKHVGAVKGLTTAASIWATTAIGLAAGLGFWPAAVTATAVAFLALTVLKPVSRLARRLSAGRATRVRVLLMPGASAAGVIAALDAVPDPARRIEIGEGVTGQTEVRAEFPASDRATLRAVVGPLAGRDDVASVGLGGAEG